MKKTTIFLFLFLVTNILHGQNFQIGDKAFGGVIFKIDPSGQSGLVISEFDSPQSFEWGCYLTQISGTDSSFGTGLTNTTSIISSCTQANIAALYAFNSTLNGYDDWYLPSIAELRTAIKNIKNVDPYAVFNSVLWSSSQFGSSSGSAYFFNPNIAGGIISWGSKFAPKKIRLIRSFCINNNDIISQEVYQVKNSDTLSLNLSTIYKAINWNQNIIGIDSKISSTGFYDLTTIDTLNCSSNDSLFVIFNNPKILSTDDTVCAGTTLQFSYSLGGTGYSFNVGSHGPSMGYIFYDKGNSNSNWRFMEAATVCDSGNYGCNGVSISGSNATNIGSGWSNTESIISNCSQLSAAKRCYLRNVNGFNDFFLPSKDELNSIYQNLYQNGINIFSGLKPNITLQNAYQLWPNSIKTMGFISSSQTSSTNAWRQSFIDGAQVDWPGKLQNYLIKPVRRFSDQPICEWMGSDTNSTFNLTIDSTTNIYLKINYLGVISFDTLTIYVVPNAQLVYDSIVQPTCNGSAVGSIHLNNDPNLNYSWFNNGSLLSTNYSINNLGPGTYEVSVTNQYGCSTDDTINLYQDEPILNFYTVSDISCYGAADGEVHLDSTSSLRPLSYFFNNQPFTDSINNIGPGQYLIQFIDSIGCSGSDTLTLNSPDSLSLGVTKTDASCFGSQDGISNVQVSGGNGSYTSSWRSVGGTSILSTSTSLSGVPSGTYRYKVVDLKGCSDSVDVTITQPAAPLSVAINSHTDVLCYGAPTGSLGVAAAGGTQGTGYQYLWQNSSGSTVGSSAVVNGLPAGVYTCLVTDTKGCSTSITDTLLQPASAVSLTSNGTSNVSCFGGNNGLAWVSPIGGTPPYSYSWNNGNSNDTASNLVAGSYTVNVTDNNNCVYTQGYTITQPTLLINSYTKSSYYGNTNVSCPGGLDGSIDLTPSGGTPPYSYSWSTGSTSQDLSGVGAGSYSCTITDFKGCTSIATVTMTEPTAFTWNNTITDVTCNGLQNGSIVTTITGGNAPYAVDWSSSANKSNKTEVTFRVDLSQQSISALGIKLVFQGTLGILNLTTSNSDSVYFGNKKFNPGDTIYWRYFNGSNAETVPIACGAITSLSVFERYLVVPDHDTILPIVCFSSCIQCDGTVGNGMDGTIQTTSKTLNNLGAGNYTYNLVDRNGCLSSQTINVAEPNVLAIIQDSISQVSCYQSANGAIYTSISGGNGGHTYLWSNGATTEDLTGLSAGTYTLTVTDSKNCSASATYIVTEPDSLSVTGVISTYLGSNNISCFGALDGAVDISVAGGTLPYAYSWNTGDTTQDLSSIAAGSYGLTVTDANGCQKTKSYTLNQPTALSTSTSATDVTCNGDANGALTITPSGGTTPYLITVQGDSSALGISKVTFLLNMDSLQNNNSKEVIIKNAGTHSMKRILGTNTYWFTIELPAGDTAYYRFANGSTIEAVPSSCALNSGGTTLERWLIVPQEDTLLPRVCFAQCLDCDLTSNSGNNGFYTDTIVQVQSLFASNISINVADANGCYIQVIDTVSQPLSLVLSQSLILDPTCPQNADGEMAVMGSGGTAPYTYLWSTGSTNDTVLNASIGNYWVYVSDANGCADTVHYSLTAPEPFDFEEICVLSVDSATGKNLIVWDKTANKRTSDYVILKENAQGQFVQAGTQPYLNLSVYADLASNPQAQPDRYKLALIDSCGNYSDTSDYHRTIHLQSNLGTTGDVNLTWTGYEGKPVQSYELWRWVTAGNLVQIATVAASVTSYTDQNPPVAPNVYYVVNAIFPSSCSPTSGKTTAFEVSKSNILNQTGISINENWALKNVKVYPNPNAGIFTIEFINGFEAEQISIVDGVGRVIRDLSTHGETTISVDLSNEPKGVYRISIRHQNGQTNLPIVVQ